MRAPDDEIGAGDRVGETLARAGAHLLDAEQQHDAERDRQHGKQRRQPAVGERLQGEPQDDHAATPVAVAAMSSSRRTRSKRCASVSSWLTIRMVAPRGLSLGKQKIEESRLAAAIERRRRLVGNDEFRPADQGARGGDALLLADAQTRGGRGLDAVGFEPERCEQPAASVRAVPRSLARARRPGAKRKRQHDVVEHRAVGQQIEHLEDDAEVLGAKLVARTAGHGVQVLAEHLDAARIRQQRSRTAG